MKDEITYEVKQNDMEKENLKSKTRDAADSEGAALLSSNSVEDLSLREDELLGGPQVLRRSQATRRETRRIWTRCTSIVGKMMITLLSFIGLLTILGHAVSSVRQGHSYYGTYDSDFTVSYDIDPCYCGDSVQEAVENGCQYDRLTGGWLPNRCRDDELSLEFDSAGDGPNGTWLYWADEEHKQLLTWEGMALRSFDHPRVTYAMWEWHRQHCFFEWRKEHRMKATPGKFYQSPSDTEHHIKHCIQVLSEDVDANTPAMMVG